MGVELGDTDRRNYYNETPQAELDAKLGVKRSPALAEPGLEAPVELGTEAASTNPTEPEPVESKRTLGGIILKSGFGGARETLRAPQTLITEDRITPPHIPNQ